MRIWIITPFEPIPTDGDVRLMRAGMLCETLAERSHQVTWWTPDFEHFAKRHRTGKDTNIRISHHYEVRLLESLGYRAHVGPRRLLHNHLLARRWGKAARAVNHSPNLILCAWPTPDLCHEAVRYGTRKNIPVVIDIRGLWPDLWIGVFPKLLRPLGRVILHPYYRMARRTFGRAAAITGVTDEYISWALRRAGRQGRPRDRAFGFEFKNTPLGPGERSTARTQLEEKGFTPDDRLLCIFAGTFGRSFEFESVVEAARVLDRTVPGKVRLLLCGSGDRWESIEQQARGIDSLQVLPRVSLSELRLLYEEASIGLAPYRNIENFQKNVPNKINEFLAMGLAILSPVSGCIRELIEKQDVGVAYEPENPESLAKNIRDLLADPERLAKLRKNDLRSREETGVPNQVYSEFAAHLEGIADGSSTPSVNGDET